jgi:AraC-like DNA-binding protein
MGRSIPPGGMVRAGVAATLRAHLEARYPKVAFDRLVLAAGLDPALLAVPDTMIDQDRWVAVLEATARETGNPCFSIELAFALPWRDLGVLGYVILHSPTVGAAMENSARYLAVQQTGGSLALTVGPAIARYTYAMLDPRITEYGQNAESVFALVVRIVRELAGVASWGPREVTFTHRGPDDPGRHERLLRCPVRFARKENALVLASGDLATRLATADATLLPILIRHAAESLTRAPSKGAFSDEVRRAVIAAISAGEPTIEEVATRLGTNPRSVQRRLAADRLSFKAIVETSRLALSERYLADPRLSLTEAAFLLGYSDLSAFSRAFRRWTGKTALEFRRSLAPGAT